MINGADDKRFPYKSVKSKFEKLKKKSPKSKLKKVKGDHFFLILDREKTMKRIKEIIEKN